MDLKTSSTSNSTKESATCTNERPSPPESQSNTRSITPRKLDRFFTRRSWVSLESNAAHQALRQLTSSAANSAWDPPSFASLNPVLEEGLSLSLPSSVDPARPRSKRRKIRHTSGDGGENCDLPSPVQTSPTTFKSPSALSPRHSPTDSYTSGQRGNMLLDSDDDASESDREAVSRPIRRPLQLQYRGLPGLLVERTNGGSCRPRCQYISHPVSDWRMETADFCSRPENSYHCQSLTGSQGQTALPFCVAAANKHDIAGVGDEEGFVRLLETDDYLTPARSPFQAHGNAVLDLAFSEDDRTLATGSGDQLGRVIDVATGDTVCVLAHHTATIKQVRFQPGRGSGSVLATSSRDGSVQIWDLRCYGGPVQEIPGFEDLSSVRTGRFRSSARGCVINSIHNAHAREQRQVKEMLVATRHSLGDSLPSVTSLQFLPSGREHLIVSGCDADASIRLWDIRSTIVSKYQNKSTPISATAVPDSHATWRPWGISALALGSDGERLYAVCKDSTIYAYSTEHLVLGHAPDLAVTTSNFETPRRRFQSAARGLGPLYGFRHPLFHVASFYVKAAVRPAKDGKSELLAVGSSDYCSVLFPTDERHLRYAWDRSSQHQPRREEVAVLQRGGSWWEPNVACANPRGGSEPVRPMDTIPIVQSGTPLVRAHEKEVGAVAWTRRGDLVSLSDDYTVRCWKESRAEARQLRLGGETGGQRWCAGWADVDEGWDGDDEEDW